MYSLFLSMVFSRGVSFYLDRFLMRQAFHKTAYPLIIWTLSLAVCCGLCMCVVDCVCVLGAWDLLYFVDFCYVLVFIMKYSVEWNDLLQSLWCVPILVLSVPGPTGRHGCWQPKLASTGLTKRSDRFGAVADPAGVRSVWPVGLTSP